MKTPSDDFPNDADGARDALGAPLLSSAKSREAHREIERAIHSGQYPPGSRLKELELAAQLGMSRTPVRDAIRQLSRDGLVDIVRNRGATVRGWDLSEVEDAYELRAVLEGFCASRAATRMDAAATAHLVELEAEFERQLAADPIDVDLLARLNSAFHRAIVAGSGSARAAEVLPSTEASAEMRRAFWESPRAREVTLVYHREIVESVRAHDAVRADAVMRSHVFAIKDFFAQQERAARIQRLVDQQHDLAS